MSQVSNVTEKESKSTTPDLGIHASSEIGTLKRLLIHSPDRGIGKVIPNKAQDWLYEDIVDLRKMREEYDVYVQLLLHFLDPSKIGKLRKSREKLKDDDKRPGFFKPESPDYFQSDKVLDVESVLSKILEDKEVRQNLVASICGVEHCGYHIRKRLMELPTHELAKTLISGYSNADERYIFAPLPNLIFTRDIGVVINDHLLLTRPAKAARYRESLITKHIAYHFFFQNRDKDWDKVIEVFEDEDYFLLDEEEQVHHRVTLEGGDIMMIAPRHLLIGCSERTSSAAIGKLIPMLFDKKLLDKVTVIKIPSKRNYMHIDTLFTMVRRNVWVLYGPLSRKGRETRGMHYSLMEDMSNDLEGLQGEKIEIIQYDRSWPDYRARYDERNPKPEYVEDLFEQISRHDFACKAEMKFIYSGGGEFPFNEREQWTDACNVLALKEGVVIGYDRNRKTAEAFKANGFKVVDADDLIADFESGKTTPDEVENTLILLTAGELSRARGGSHCMSMPLLRDGVDEH